MQCELLHQEAMSHNKEFKADNYYYVPHQEFKVDPLVYERH